VAEERKYGELVAAAAFPTERRERLSLAALGIGGEAGECIDIIKKHLHHGNPLDTGHLREELGDLLWCLTLLADEVGASLQAIALQNIIKLRERYPDRYPDPINDVVVRL